ncbi:MAG: sulfurtransferase [Candidatus Dormibacteria bacterium]
MPVLSPLVGVEWLLEHLGDPRLQILDVRWSVASGAQRHAYLSGHLPGAQFIDLDHDLAGPAGPRGRHPLPSPGAFATAMRRAGVSAASKVIAYDEVTGAAARAWWLLRAGGHGRVQVLDGGMAAWLAAGGPLEEGPVTAPTGDFSCSGFGGWLSADETADLVRRGGMLLDARSRERFQGSPSPLDPRPGHVPGAQSLPWTDAYREGSVAGRPELEAALARASGGRPPEAAYCGSGVTACALILALESHGYPGVRLFPGSWSEWALDPDRPAELSGSRPAGP